MKFEYQIESKNFVQILNKIIIIVIGCIFFIILLNILSFTHAHITTLRLAHPVAWQMVNRAECCTPVYIFLFLIGLLHMQRQPFEGGIVRQLSEQRFFVRYQNSELFIYFSSFLFCLYFFFLKIQILQLYAG